MPIDPLVSVLIPAYNAEQWFAETLESVKNQTHRNLEVIVVDDGSKDKTAAIADAFSRAFNKLVLVQQRNRGQTAALNIALHHASGKYIQYLDADDILLPQKIEMQVHRLESNPGYIASAAWGRFHDHQDNTRFISDSTWQDMQPVDWLITNWSVGGMMFPGMWLIPSDLARCVGPWREDLTLLNDTEYFPRVILASKGVLFCDAARVCYRSGLPGSLSGRKSPAALLSAFQVIAACEANLLGAENSLRARQVLSAFWQKFAHSAYPHFPGLANEALRRAFTLHPEKKEPDGGGTFRFVSSVLGWKAARLLQKWSGRE